MSATPFDPVCGMPVSTSSRWRLGEASSTLYFCSELCLTRYRADPARYRAVAGENEAALRRVAYLSMEIALDSRMPTYSGGLGVLAGDMLRSCADLRIPVVGVTLVHRAGYFRQRIDASGRQLESPARWDPSALLAEGPASTQVDIEGRSVVLRAWRYDVKGEGGFVVPVFLLDSDQPENAEWDRHLTDVLYGGDEWYRLAQEVVLGRGAVRMLTALGYNAIAKFHLNEGHAALAAWDLIGGSTSPDVERIAEVRRRCVFTTHTPVAAGHDRFPYPIVRRMLGPDEPYDLLEMLGGREALNMTDLALNSSGFANGVALRHEQVAQEMFPGYAIGHVTNGVHSTTWTCAEFRALFDYHVPHWREDPALLRHALLIPDVYVERAHAAAKARLIETVRTRSGVQLDPSALTIGFGRRAAVYKRAELILSDLERLRQLPVQLVFAGKAHPEDKPGKELLARLIATLRRLGPEVPAVYLDDYGLDLALTMVSGCDVWLNTPEPTMEASGTSGMKAAHNGVPSLSVLDGWWIEGCMDGITGWAVSDANSIYWRLEHDVLPAFRSPSRWTTIMKHAIALNASFFNTHRMVQQYAAGAYLSS